MGLKEWITRLADDRPADGKLASAAQSALAGMAPLYGIGAWANRVLHDIGAKESHRVAAPVFSVGNVTVGGTGKTPFCMLLVEWLRAQGKRPAIVTRGYGRDDENALVVVHDGRRLRATTREAGDEPVLLARALKDVPVVACADRTRAAEVILRRGIADTIVLDDGFQHHKLKRDADIVLVDATRPLSRLRLLPRGTLRELPGTMRRAHLIVMTRWGQSRDAKRALADAKAAAPSVPIVRTRVVVTSASHIATREAVELASLRGKRAVLLCGVGNPQSVESTARELGIEIAARRFLQDHATITKELLMRMDSVRSRVRADMLLVTEKDAVKLAELGSLPHELIAIRATAQWVSERDADLAHKVLRARLDARPVRGLVQ